MDKRHFSHTIFVDRPSPVAIHLFTPKGEETWVPGWDPVYITPVSGEMKEEMLFTTGTGDELTYWTCMKWRPQDGHARYFRLTPASRAAFVDVRCTDADKGWTQVTMCYEMHALTPSGDDDLQHMTQETFEKSIDNWAVLIHALKR